jgi:hypothetical protein
VPDLDVRTPRNGPGGPLRGSVVWFGGAKGAPQEERREPRHGAGAARAARVPRNLQEPSHGVHAIWRGGYLSNEGMSGQGPGHPAVSSNPKGLENSAVGTLKDARLERRRDSLHVTVVHGQRATRPVVNVQNKMHLAAVRERKTRTPNPLFMHVPTTWRCSFHNALGHLLWR